jgi:transcriptional regulator with XRE-family HTH domain
VDKQVIAQRIRAFRKLKGYTQLELADQMGVSISILGSIERGMRKPDPKTLKRIAEVLGIELEELLQLTPNQSG